jgi:general secretion pathway protein D
VLATPHILATDNVQADISVGQSVPLQTNIGSGLGALAGLAGGQAGAAGLAGALGGLGGLGLGGPTYKDVGIKLSIKPHINDSDQVRLEVKEEISELGTRDGALGAASINQRSASTTLIVRDQQTVVIGGLMRESEVIGQTKIPILGDLPILGALFRQQIREKSKTNLLLILTPYVVRDQEDLRAIFERKMQERQEFLDRYFIFNDDVAWEPPKDYARANGLVEAIRQTMIDEQERERLAAESRPRAPRTHEAVEPISLPSGAGARTGPASTVGGDATPTRPTTGGTSNTGASPPRGKIKPSNVPTAPRREGGGERVE